MDTNLLAALIGVFAGAFGYWFAIFCMQPILRYRDIKNNILMDFIYFAQVINAEGLNDEMKKLYSERVLANRKKSAQLTASIQDLPKCYLKFLKWKKYYPNEAAEHLIGYSNTTDYEMSHKIETAIRKKLGLPYEEI